MKRIVYILVILSLVLSLAACTDEITVYDRLSLLSMRSYECITMNVKTTTNGVSLESSYTVSDGSVIFSVERLNPFSADSEDMKSKIQGIATVVDGVVTQLDGVPVELPSYTTLLGAFNFKEDYFANAKETETSFSADITNLSDFIGNELTAQFAKIVVNYDTLSFESIVITYSTQSSYVVITYEFI